MANHLAFVMSSVLLLQEQITCMAIAPIQLIPDNYSQHIVLTILQHTCTQMWQLCTNFGIGNKIHNVLVTCFIFKKSDELQPYLLRSFKVRNGHLERSPMLGRYCGNNTAQTVESSGNKVKVQFRSDGSVSNGGFRITYTSNEDAGGWSESFC